MPKKQTSRKKTIKRLRHGGAASYQKVRVKPTHKRNTRSKAIGQMFSEFQNFFTRKRKVHPIN